jgi:hypothetical protein
MSITITEVRNAKSLQLDNLLMDVEINHPHYGWIPYTLNSNDTDTTINNDEILSLIGDNFAPYAPLTQEDLDAQLIESVRSYRNMLLASEVDPLVSNPLRWNDLTDAQRTAWTQYRAELLNVPQQANFPNNVDWPVKPS